MSDNFLDLAQLDNIPDQTLLEDGTEHEVQVLKAEIGESKPENKTAGQKYMKVMLKSTEEPDSKPMSDVFMLPFAGLETDQFNQRGRALRTFFQCFQFDYTSGFNIFEETEQLVGLTGTVIVRLKDDPEYGEQNEVKKYL